MNTSKPIQIFKPGTHTAMSGAVLNFTEAHMAASAAAYNPALHEAPIVVGHPKHDDPAYGWVKSLAFADGLEAEEHQIDPAFAEMRTAGRFKKISASFYTPDSPQNPVPGVYYLRHVGYLGAQPPAVKGLKQAEFAEAEEGVVEFGDWDDRNNAGLLRSLRDWIIGKFGLDEADKALPKWDVQSLADSAAQPETVDPAPLTNFTEGEPMSAEEKARLAALEAENATLKANQASFAETEKARVRSAAHASHLAFSEGLIKLGKLLPAQLDVAVATLDFMAGQETVVEFGEGDAKQPLVEGFKTFLQALTKQVEFSELVKPEGAGETVEFAAPGGYTVDAERLETHNKALAYQAKHPNTPYQTAVNAVGGN
jgi:hypothetical protein